MSIFIQNLLAMITTESQLSLTDVKQKTIRYYNFIKYFNSTFDRRKMLILLRQGRIAKWFSGIESGKQFLWV